MASSNSRRPANQPKPNTRFLNNIIRDTNSHNRALLAKENAESQARLRDLEEAEQEKRREEERRLRRTRPGPSDTRKRMLGDIAAHLGGPSKKRKTENDERPANGLASDSKASAAPNRRTHDTGRKADDEKLRSSSRERNAKPDDDGRRSERSSEKSRRSSRREHDRNDGDRGQKDLFSKIEDIRRSNHRDKSHKDDDRRRSRGERERSHRHRSPKRKDDREDEKEDDRRTSKSKRRRSPSLKSHKDESDSDPLDDIIGPAPPSATEPAVRRRGRGATSGASGIDSRFAADYDPKLDVTPEPDDRADGHGVNGGSNANGGGEADWDSAVEAFRDRAKWRQQGAERLRSAGFSEEEIRRWEKGGQKDESDVRWTGKGGLREWDRGKVLDDDGQVTVEAEWGRLKGT